MIVSRADAARATDLGRLVACRGVDARLERLLLVLRVRKVIGAVRKEWFRGVSIGCNRQECFRLGNLL